MSLKKRRNTLCITKHNNDRKTVNYCFDRISDILAAILVCSYIFLIFFKSNIHDRVALPLLDQVDLIAANIGLRLQTISITGFNQTSDDDIFVALELDNVQTLLAFNASEAVKRLEMLPWVKSVQIKQTFPHRLDIFIHEYQAYALWTSKSGEVLINRNGRRLVAVRASEINNLPVIEGQGAPEAAPALFNELEKYPELLANVLRAVRIMDRRWTLIFKGQRKVLLPEERCNLAIATIMRGNVGERLIDHNFAVFDLRNEGEVIVRPYSKKLQSMTTNNRRQKSIQTLKG